MKPHLAITAYVGDDASPPPAMVDNKAVQLKGMEGGCGEKQRAKWPVPSNPTVSHRTENPGRT